MVDQTRSRTAVVEPHVQSIEDQLSPQVVRHGPAHNLSGEGIQHKREVKPALPASDVGDVCHPEAIWRLWGEVAFHEIGDFAHVFFGSSPASSTSTSLSSTTSEKTWLAHQSSNPFSSAPKAEDPQLAKWMRGAP